MDSPWKGLLKHAENLSIVPQIQDEVLFFRVSGLVYSIGVFLLLVSWHLPALSGQVKQFF